MFILGDINFHARRIGTINRRGQKMESAYGAGFWRACHGSKSTTSPWRHIDVTRR